MNLSIIQFVKLFAVDKYDRNYYNGKLLIQLLLKL